jgi:transcriptional regulator with XRE-family HTH domain
VEVFMGFVPVKCFLRDFRKEAGFTQRDVATRIGTNKSHISEYENLGTIMSLPTLKAVSHLFNRSLDEFYEWEYVETPRKEDEDE